VAVPNALRYVEHEARVWRRLWRGTLFSGMVAPVLFLGAMGVGLGGIVDQRVGTVEGVRYLAFVAPGVLAASAMQNAAGAALWQVVAGHKWTRSFRAATATPLRPSDVYAGYLTWLGTHTALHAAPFVAVAALMGGVASPWGALAVPAAVLCALAFAAPLAAWSISQESETHFAAVMRLVIQPLYLFSGTFFPLQNLPTGVEAVARVTPLWHAIELCRGATTGTIEPATAALHTVVLLGFVVVGALWGVRTFTQRLSP
jgi:lipooligosaccharide transport system permease protein